MEKPVLAPFNLQQGHRLLGLRVGASFQRNPLDCPPAGIIFEGNPGHEIAVAPPRSANCVLAGIFDLGVKISVVAVLAGSFSGFQRASLSKKV
jgi:hypothetical protein